MNFLFMGGLLQNLLSLVRCSYASSWRVIKVIGFNGVDGKVVCPRAACMATAPSIQPASLRPERVLNVERQVDAAARMHFEWKWRMKFSSCSRIFSSLQPLYPRLLVQATNRRKGYSCSALLPRG